MEIIHGEKLGPRVVSVTPLDDYLLKLKFNNGEIRFFDVKNIYSEPCFRKLQIPVFFKNVRVEFGTITWDEDIDYCPDTLYEQSYIL